MGRWGLPSSGPREVLSLGFEIDRMDTVTRGMREDDVEKDTYGRLRCAHCDSKLKKRAAEDGLGAIRTCPDCGREWQEL